MKTTAILSVLIAMTPFMMVSVDATSCTIDNPNCCVPGFEPGCTGTIVAPILKTFGCDPRITDPCPENWNNMVTAELYESTQILSYKVDVLHERLTNEIQFYQFVTIVTVLASVGIASGVLITDFRKTRPK